MWILISRVVKVSGTIEQGAIYALVAFSVFSWALIFLKILTFGRARRNQKKFLSQFNAAGSIGEFAPPRLRTPAPLLAIFNAGVEALGHAGHSDNRHEPLGPADLHEKVMLEVKYAGRVELRALRWGSGWLSAIGCSSPFIGMLGTVFGIMAVFQSAGDLKSVSLATLAPGIASALIAAAAGLAVAIPAIVAFNWIQGRVDVIQDEIDSFMAKMDFTTRIELGTAVADDEPVMAAIDR